uniref:Uncharacterized protein n=1 Tax=Rhizophora mucronata TaxID=61149 RepID=A0A2P2MQH4_RHIMU
MSTAKNFDIELFWYGVNCRDLICPCPFCNHQSL